MKENPINTVPRDGTHVLLKFSDGSVNSPSNVWIEGWYNVEKASSEDFGRPREHWEPRAPSEAEMWDTASLNSHGCGCCSGENEAPLAWAPLPEVVS